MISKLAWVIIQELIKLALERTVKEQLPRIYKRIDAELPILISSGVPPSLVDGLFLSSISDAIGRRADRLQGLLVKLLYDPAITAEKVARARITNPR